MIEILNEQDNWWGGSRVKMSGAQYAHFLKYMTDGIWSIDPNMAVSVGGLAKVDFDWMNECRNTWETSYGDFPEYNPVTNTGIIWSVHYYGYVVERYGETHLARLPNDGEMEDVAQSLQTWCEAHNAYVWIGEIGYDSEGNSDLLSPMILGLTREQSAGQHLIDAANIFFQKDRIRFFTFFEWVDENGSQRFSNMGIFGNEGEGFANKQSYPIVKGYFDESGVIVVPPDTTVIPPDTILVSVDTVYITDTVYVSSSTISRIRLTGGRYHVYVDGVKKIGYHISEKEALERSINILINNPDSDIEYRRDPIRVE